MYPLLPKSYKNAFPFKIACPSYIYPDAVIPNVRALGPHVDEIELILFESKPQSLPTEKEIKELKKLSNDLDVTYNIHLPLDLHLGNTDTAERKKAVETLKGIFSLTAPLNPTTHTLHLIGEGSIDDGENRKGWKLRISESLKTLLADGISGASVSIETLSYPLDWIQDIIHAFDLCVCMDVGHLLLRDIPLSETIDRYEERLSIIHLHGVDGKKDHQSIDTLSDAARDLLFDVLSRFQGVVSIEVFSFDKLSESLRVFDNLWNRIEK